MALNIVNVAGAPGRIEFHDAVGIAQPLILNKGNIVSVGGVFTRNVTFYSFTNRCLIVIKTGDGQMHKFEAQEIANKAAWNNGTVAALNTAVAEIGSWLP